MVKHSDLKSSCFRAVVICAILLVCIAGPGYCEEDSAALVLDVSPVNGGTVNLSPGVHTYDRDTEVQLIAVPRPGYQFVYWMGDVTNATASNTTVYLDSPKIVIAVFERSKFEIAELEVDDEYQVSAGGGGGLVGSGSDYAAALEQAGGGAKRPSIHYRRQPEQPEPPEPPQPPEPPTNDNLPIPAPEPATIVFLLTGMFSLAGCRRRRAEIKHQM
jgi:hypothetical protein